MAKSTDHRQVRSTFRELLVNPRRTKESFREGNANIPALMFWDMMASHGIRASTWEVMMDRYYKRKYGVDNVQKISQEKTNLQRALSKNNLTWNRFMTAVEILGYKTLTFMATMEYESGDVYQHKVKIRNPFANPATKANPDED